MQNKINQEYIQIIRNHFQDDFFIKTAHIPKGEKIHLLSTVCQKTLFIFLIKKDISKLWIFLYQKTIISIEYYI